MKMPNKHSAPRGCRPSLRGDDVEIHAAGGFMGLFQTPYERQRRAQEAAQQKVFDDANANARAQALSVKQQADWAAAQSRNALDHAYPNRADVTTLSTGGGARGAGNDFGMAPPAPVPQSSPTLQNTSPPPTLRGSNDFGLAPAAVPGESAQAAFLRRNPGVAANRAANPTMPQPAAPAPVAPAPLRANSFADNAGQYAAANAAEGVHGGMTMKEWAAPGRSTGRPIDQGNTAGDPNYSHFAGGGVPMPVKPSWSMDPLGAPNRGLKAAGAGQGNSFGLAMADGGQQPHPASILGIANSLRGAWNSASQSAAETAAALQHRFNPAPTVIPVQPAAAPAPAQPDAIQQGVEAIKGNTRAEQMKALGLRHGGDLKTGMGGEVPGEGVGDKIPAKYEPGEFVVSNDMLEAEPGLRKHLASLREEVLADKGMTPEQADAKAIQPKGLRAMDSFDWQKITDGQVAKALASGPPTAETAAAIKPPVGPAPTYGLPPNPPINGTPAVAAVPVEAAAPVGRVANVVGKAKALGSGALRAAPLVGGGLEMAQGVAEGDAGRVGHGAFDTAMGGAMYIPGAAPFATAAILAGHAPDIINGIAGDEDATGSLINKAVRGTGKLFGQDWGVDDTAYQKLKADRLRQGAGPAPVQAKPTAAEAAKEEVKAPTLGDVRNVDPEAGTQDVFTKGVWKTVSTPEAKAARQLRDQQYDQRLATDAANSRADTARQLAFFEKLNGGGASDEAHMFDGLFPNARAQAMQQHLQTKASLRNADLNAQTQLQTTGMNNEVTREGNRMTLQGHMAPLLYAQQQRVLAGQLLRAAGGDLGVASKMAIANGVDPAHLQTAWQADTSNRTAEQGMGLRAQEQFAKDFQAFGTKDGVSVLDPALSAAKQQAMRKILPGVDNLTAEARSKKMPEAELLGKIYDRLAANPQMGFDKLNPLNPKGSAYDAFPDLTGAKLSRQGLTGAFTPGSERNGYYLTLQDGREIPLGSNLSQGEINILSHATKTGKWTGAPKITQ